MHYTYTTKDYSKSGRGWIRYIHEVTNLEANYAALFSEAHVTIPKLPGDRKNWAALAHITIVTVKDYRYHWYILQQKISGTRRMEQIGKGNKFANDNSTSSEKELAERILKDANEKGWG